MQAASLEVLEKANLPAPQARAIVQAIEIEIAGARDTLRAAGDVGHAPWTGAQNRGYAQRDPCECQQRQMYGALLGQMAVLLGIAYFFVAHVGR
ncbi:MAG: hypothetical protein E6K39_17145 [Gammaproteobacteria bacterium]|nr:MAG: hypothetical protein E6K39_17145 [Gammaproteobacteria bacterium]